MSTIEPTDCGEVRVTWANSSGGPEPASIRPKGHTHTPEDIAERSHLVPGQKGRLTRLRWPQNRWGSGKERSALPEPPAERGAELAAKGRGAPPASRWAERCEGSRQPRRTASAAEAVMLSCDPDGPGAGYGGDVLARGSENKG